MDQELKVKWTEALRSGKYEQGDSFLKKGNSYCCLGVLLDIQGAEWYKTSSVGDAAKINGIVATLKDEERLEEDFAGGMNYETQVTLSRMNDSGRSFLSIANYIEANL
jgi:hypothetical protein